MKNRALTTLLTILVSLQAGLLLGQLNSGDAHAETPAAEEVPFYDPPRLYCRPFEVPLEGARSAMETNDRTTPIGKWVAEQEASYELFSIDFALGQKPTGYPLGMAYVCLSPR